MPRSQATKSKIAKGVRKYHSACRKAMGKAPKKTVKKNKKKARSVFAPGRLVDNRSQRGRGPGRKGPAPRVKADGSADRRFKGRATPVGNLISL